MSQTPVGLAGAYAALSTVELPEHWSGEQALAVWELLTELADRVWARYELALIELIDADSGPQRDPNQPDLFDPDDSIAF